MIFNKHSALEGQHAFLGASKYHWINYDESKVADAYSKFLATQRVQCFMILHVNVFGLDRNCRSLKNIEHVR